MNGMGVVGLLCEYKKTIVQRGYGVSLTGAMCKGKARRRFIDTRYKKRVRVRWQESRKHIGVREWGVYEYGMKTQELCY